MVNSSKRIAARAVIDGCLLSVEIEYDNHIKHIRPIDGKPELLLVPGFVDLHVHGGNGHDIMQGYDAIVETAHYHAANGTVALAPTTMTAPTGDIEAALGNIARAHENRSNDMAEIVGAHLEGPFINSEALGAQPDFCLKPDAALAQRWANMCPIKIATVAPELEQALLLATVLQQNGTRVQIGHTRCTAHEANVGLTTGFSGFTHLYNAMTPLHHRDSGAVSSALAHATYAEIICDGLHVDREAVLAARRAIPNCYAVTDCTAAGGMNDGTFCLGRHSVIKESNSVRLTDGTLAGSCINLFDAFANLYRWGLSLEECVRWCCERPAQYIGREDIYAIKPGAAATFNILEETSLTSRNIRLHQTVIHGRITS